MYSGQKSYLSTPHHALQRIDRRLPMTLPFLISHSSSHYYSCNILPSLSSHLPLSYRLMWPRMDSVYRRHLHRRKENIVVIMGATGCGKSRLSVDLASRFYAEIINCDKMQVYKGLDITTNKIPHHERRGVPHHLLGEFDHLEGEVTPFDFRSHGGAAVHDIASRQKLPLIVGGSNSFIHSLVVNRFDPYSDFDVFSCPHFITPEFRYRCCFIWVDVFFPVLSLYLSNRVDDMLESGMFEELVEFYDPEEAETEHRVGLRKAIGVPEFDKYFRKYPARREREEGQREAYEEAGKEIKENTRQLARRQMGKMVRLRKGGWDLKRVDGTDALRVESSEKKWSEIWEKQVVEPSVELVKRFLEE